MKQFLSCIITDDEPFARKGLAGYAKQSGRLNIMEVCENGLQLKEMLASVQPDLLFLDIEMPHINGVDLLRSLLNPPKVIFTTAYDQYAIESYELEVLDYLLKPISYARFLKSVDKAFDYFASKENINPPAFIFVKAGGRLEKIEFSELLFVEGMENYLAVHCIQKKIIIHSTLKAFLEKLPAQQFIQTHKSYIVALDKVQSIEGNALFIGVHEVPVSRNWLSTVTEKIINR